MIPKREKVKLAWGVNQSVNTAAFFAKCSKSYAARVYKELNNTNQLKPYPTLQTDSYHEDLANPLQSQVGGSHYKNMKIQPVEFIHANGIPFIEGAVIKYVCRWRNKNGLDDLQKAIHFIELLMQLEKNKEGE